MQYPQLPVVAFLSAFLVLIPLPSHWRAHNVATLGLIFWLFFTNIIYGVNAIVWAGNVNDYIPVWCDISERLFLKPKFPFNLRPALATKFTAGASYALPLCTFCICKHLEMVSSSRRASYSVNDRWRRMIFEGVVCFFVPLVFMALRAFIHSLQHFVLIIIQITLFKVIGTTLLKISAVKLPSMSPFQPSSSSGSRNSSFL